MPLKESEAIVLRTYPFRESDLLVTLFTRTEGKVRGVARAAKKSRRRFGGALEPRTYVKVTYEDRERQVHFAGPIPMLRFEGHARAACAAKAPMGALRRNDAGRVRGAAAVAIAVRTEARREIHLDLHGPAMAAREAALRHGSSRARGGARR